MKGKCLKFFLKDPKLNEVPRVPFLPLIWRNSCWPRSQAEAAAVTMSLVVRHNVTLLRYNVTLWRYNVMSLSYLLFVIFFTPTYFLSCKKYTNKVRKFGTKNFFATKKRKWKFWNTNSHFCISTAILGKEREGWLLLPVPLRKDVHIYVCIPWRNLLKAVFIAFSVEKSTPVGKKHTTVDQVSQLLPEGISKHGVQTKNSAIWVLIGQTHGKCCSSKTISARSSAEVSKSSQLKALQFI